MPAPVRVRLDWSLVLRKTDIPPRVITELKGLFEKPNPKFFKAQTMGFWPGNIKRTVCAWEEDETFLFLPRGAIPEVEKQLVSIGLSVELIDDTIDTKPIGFKLHGTPRPEQEAAIRDIISAGGGILRGPCGSGKTAVLLSVIARLNRRAIVVVHTGALMKQWKAAVTEWLGVSPGSIGGGGKPNLNSSVVIAMQPSLARMTKLDNPPAWTDGFSVLVGDECFTADTLVLMADGTHKSIACVQPGDVVAVGGRVRATMHKPYTGRVFQVGAANATWNHPFVTARGKTTALSLGRSDVLWYDPLHDRRPLHADMCYLREEAQAAQPAQLVQETQEWTVRSRDGTMQTMRALRTSETERCACDIEVRRGPAMEQGADQRNGRTDGCCCGCAHRQETPGDVRVDATTTDRSSDQRQVSSRMDSRTTRQVPATRTDRSIESQDTRNDAFWVPSLPNRALPTMEQSIGERGLDFARADGIHSRVYHQDTQHSETISNRLCSSGEQVGSGAGQTVPFDSETNSCRCSQGRVPNCCWLDGVAIQDSIQLQPNLANVRRLADVHEVTVYNLDTEHGMYVAGGVLCYNCHHWAATSFQAVSKLFRSRYFIGASADERRKDGLEFLIGWTFGPVVHEIQRKELEDVGRLVPIRMLVVPTAYKDDLYLESISNDELPPWTEMISRMMDVRRAESLERAKVIWKVVQRIVADVPNARVLVLNDRVEACRMLVAQFDLMGLRAGLVIGGTENRVEQTRTIAGLQRGTLDVGVGTTVADEGLDIPALTHVVLTSPVHTHHQRMEQMIGRAARPFEGKTHATAVYIWDRLMFPAVPADDISRERLEEKFLDKLRVVTPDVRVLDKIDFAG